MKKIALVAFSFLLFGCTTGKLTLSKNVQPFKTIAIETSYGQYADNEYKDTIESSVNRLIKVFNTENHKFNLNRRNPKDNFYVMLDFSEICVANNQQVTAGFIISAIGLLVTPIAMLNLTDGQFVVGFWYAPKNKVIYNFTLSESLNSKNVSQEFQNATGAIFKPKAKRLSSVNEVFYQSLYNTFLNLEAQLKN